LQAHGRPLPTSTAQRFKKGYVDEILEQIFVSSFVVETITMDCMSWLNIDGAPRKVIAEQFMKLPDEKLASACLQFVMKHVENVFSIRTGLKA
jgi:hypothetical protein